MFNKKKILFILCITLIFAFMAYCITGVFSPKAVNAQYWALMPPYNVLWPLFSPVLSPRDPITGIPIPLVSELTVNTILPVQPVLAWDPCQPVPWALYNVPATFGGGLVYFDQTYGLNPWPPVYLLDPITGAPAPITWRGTWSLLLPTELGHLEYIIDLGNITFALTYGIYGDPFLNLLTAAQIWGLPPI